MHGHKLPLDGSDQMLFYIDCMYDCSEKQNKTLIDTSIYILLK